jgi:tetratricopeptide (TPR) repeat protein
MRLVRSAALLIPLVLAFPKRSHSQRLRVGVPLDQLVATAQRDSNDAAAHYNLGLGYWSKGKYDDAERSFNTAILIEPRFATAHLALAYLPFARRPKLWNETIYGRIPAEWRAAVEGSDRDYRRAMMADPMVDLRVMGAVEPGRDVGYTMSNDMVRFYDIVYQGFDDFRDGKYEEAYGRFQRLARELTWDTHPDDATTTFLYFRGLSAAHTGRLTLAIGDMKQILSRYEDAARQRSDSMTYLPLRLAEYRYLTAYLLLQDKQYGSAQELLEKVAEEDAGHFMAHVRLAELFEVQGAWDPAIRERQIAAQINPDDASLLTEWGITLGKSGRFADAEERLQEAIRLQPRDTRAYYWLGIAQQQLGKGPEARASFERFVQLAPTRFERQVTAARQRIAQLQ